jgi:SAM-dependent methyltransferase
MTEDALYNDPALARFYDPDNGWAEDTLAVVRLAATAHSVLDLGCGTGLLAAHLATLGKRVTGLDPAAAMLDIARGRPGGHSVTWIKADARVADLGKTFDLVVMTGHAFQCLLTRADRLALLRTIARHLGPTGRFIFDSRNPLAEEWRNWTPDATRHVIKDAELGPVTRWHDAAFDPKTGIATYDTVYVPLTGPERRARSCIAFPTQAEIAAGLDEAGLAAPDWFGDWAFVPFHPTATEIIPYGRRG